MQAGARNVIVLLSIIIIIVFIEFSTIYIATIINPRRACAARVTVVVLCVCVCLSLRSISATTSKSKPESDTNASSRQQKKNKTGDFLKNAPFKSYGVICSL